MVTRDATVSTALPAPWVWLVLTDVENLERWSGFEHCTDNGGRRLHDGSVWECRIVLDGRPVPVTLTVVGFAPSARLTLKSETPVLTVLETFSVLRRTRRVDVGYHLRAYSQVSAPVLQRWLDDHLDRVTDALGHLLLAPPP